MRSDAWWRLTIISIPNHQARARANYCPHPLPSSWQGHQIGWLMLSPQTRNPATHSSHSRPARAHRTDITSPTRLARDSGYSPMGLACGIEPVGSTLQEVKEFPLPLAGAHFTPTCVRMSHKTHATISAGAAAGGLVRMTTRPLESPDIISGGGRLLPQRRFHGTFDAGRRRR